MAPLSLFNFTTLNWLTRPKWQAHPIIKHWPYLLPFTHHWLNSLWKAMQIRAIQILKQSLLSGREMILSYGWNHPAQWERTSSSWSWDPRNQKEAWEKKQRKKQSCFSACVVAKMRVSNLPRSSCWTLGTLCTAGRTLSLLESMVRFCCLSLGGLSNAI